MQITPNTQAWAGTLLDKCHALVRSHLQPNLNKMFENSNFAFLEFAEKAQSSVSQLQFMEALNIVQKNRQLVTDRFFSEVERIFDDFGKPAPATAATTSPDDAPLSLLSKEDTDIQVAIQNMASAVSTGSSRELSGLRQRLAVLNNGRQLDDKDMPAGPFNLAHAFHHATNGLTLEHETRLIVYMLFDKFVLGKLHGMYREYNECLLRAGLLPNLKYSVKRNPSSNPTTATRGTGQQTSPRAAQAGAGTQSLGDELFANIMDLLARRDDNGGNGRAATGATPITNPVQQSEIVSAIDRLQHAPAAGHSRAEVIVNIQPGSKEHDAIVAGMTSQLAAERDKLFTGIDRRRTPAADAQVIDLVGMLFEHLVKDGELPNVAKAELCRLHTPYLKVAILDKSLFTNDAHPAHEFLNTLTSAAVKWVYEDDLERGIFPALRVAVQRVIDEFTNDIELFSELLVDFQKSLHELVDKAAAIEERTRQAAAGREKLDLAREHASREIETQLSGCKAPAAIRQLLNDVWLDKLMFIYLREPLAQDSSAWQLAARAIGDITRSVQPCINAQDQSELRSKLPQLRERISQAYEQLEAFGSCDIEAHLQQIFAHQEDVLNQPVDEIAVDTAVDAEQQTDVEETVTAEPAQEAMPTAAVRDAMEQLQQITFGTWFSIRENESSHPEKVKLSWHSKLSGNYMFVDSMGVRSGVWKQHDLAAMLADGRAWIINDTKEPFIKRALIGISRFLTGDLSH